MPMERKSTESDNDEQANASSESLSQNEDNAKREELDLPSDTKLLDLPTELLELILIKAVVTEVMDLKLAKCVWKEKADPVISRLKQVCSQWSNILTSDHFPISLHRTLDDTAQVIRLEVLQESAVKQGIHAMVTLKDEIFALRKVCDQCFAIDVYDRGNMEAVKDVIELPESPAVKSMITCNGSNIYCLDVIELPKSPAVKSMIACAASNCLYVGLPVDMPVLSSPPSNRLSVLRIWRDAQHKFNQSLWKHAHDLSIHMFSVSAKGNLLTFSQGSWLKPASIAVYDAKDSLQLEVFIPLYIGEFKHMGLLQKSYGNLVLSYVGERERHTRLLEITTSGNVVRQYESSHGPLTRVNFADNYDRIVIAECNKSGRMELLDPEFNLLGVYCLQQDVGKGVHIYDMKYDSERSVIMRSHFDRHSKKNVLTTFRFTEE